MTIQATYAIADLTALTALTSSERVDGYSRLVKSDSQGNQNWFTFIASSSVAANGTSILIPNDNPTTGRWFKHTGSVPALVAGTITTLSAGSAATASVSAVSGQANTYQINLGIPQGAAGSSGGNSDWIYKNSDYTAVTGDRIIADTTTPWPLKLPASPTAGQDVTIVKSDTNTLTINPQGANIKSLDPTSYNFTYSNAQEELKLIFVNSTIGWLPVPNSLNVIASNQDPYFNNVVFLCHFNGSNNSNTFTDIKGHAITPSGNPIISTSQSKFNGSSIYFDGSSGLSIVQNDDFKLSGVDFTIEAWVYMLNSTGAICSTVPGTANVGYNFFINNGILTFQSDGGNPNISSGIMVSQSNWNYIGLSKSGSNYTFAVNNTRQTIVNTTNWSDSTVNLTIGRTPRNDYPYFFYGYMNDLRITKGIARTLTLPSQQFPDN